MISVFYRFRPIRKLYLSACIGIGRYEKKLIGCSLDCFIVNKYLSFYGMFKYYLCWVPPPHVAEHGDQSVHGVQVGHGFVLQDMVSLASPPPQAAGSYPFRTITVHSLTRDFVPPSQLAEQSVHSVHCVHFGQVSVLQVLDSSRVSLQGFSSKKAKSFSKTNT